VRQTIQRLFREIPNLRIGILAHGDYCDAGSTYVTSHQDLCNNLDALAQFVQTVTPTGGGDAPECYELVLRQAQGFGWRADAQKVLVMIGDDLPHAPHDNPQRINWRDEVMALVRLGVTIYGVQALGRRHAAPFYRELAERSGGFHVPLDQFAQVTDMLLAVTYRQQGEDRVVAFAEEVAGAGRMTRSMSRTLNALTPRITALSELTSDDVRARIRASAPPGEAYIGCRPPILCRCRPRASRCWKSTPTLPSVPMPKAMACGSCRVAASTSSPRRRQSRPARGSCWSIGGVAICSAAMPRAPCLACRAV
jgi:hypothetical protein